MQKKKAKTFTFSPFFSFVGKTIFYCLIIILLIYLYQFKQVSGGTFIYNEF